MKYSALFKLWVQPYGPPASFQCASETLRCSIYDHKNEQLLNFHIIKAQESYNVKYFKEIKRLKSLQKAEEYLEPKRASMMELFWIYLTTYYFRNKSSIIDARLGKASKNIEIFKVKLGWSKSSWLFQCVGFLVLI